MGLFIRLMLKRGTVRQVGRFISRFSLKLNIQFGSIFTLWCYSVKVAITIKRNSVLDFLAKII